MESAVVFAFVAIGLLGIRVPAALVVGYPLHGLWDVLHELQAHGGFSVFEPGQATAVPLAYGIFCATYEGSASVSRGFNLLLWQSGERGYALVSDLDARELRDLGAKLAGGA